jgi:hypothetical protein
LHSLEDAIGWWQHLRPIVHALHCSLLTLLLLGALLLLLRITNHRAATRTRVISVEARKREERCGSCPCERLRRTEKARRLTKTSRGCKASGGM